MKIVLNEEEKNQISSQHEEIDSLSAPPDAAEIGVIVKLLIPSEIESIRVAVEAHEQHRDEDFNHE